MNRTVGVERSYFISDYNIIKPVEYMNDIPENLASNGSFINRVRFIQLLDLELIFKKYLVLKSRVDQLSPDDAIAYLEELKSNAMDELDKMLKEA